MAKEKNWVWVKVTVTLSLLVAMSKWRRKRRRMPQHQGRRGDEEEEEGLSYCSYTSSSSSKNSLAKSLPPPLLLLSGFNALLRRKTRYSTDLCCGGKHVGFPEKSNDSAGIFRILFFLSPYTRKALFLLLDIVPILQEGLPIPRIKRHI